MPARTTPAPQPLIPLKPQPKPQTNNPNQTNPNFKLQHPPKQNTVDRPGGVFTIGAAGHCLSKALVQARPMAPECRALVLVAAPKDSRAYLQYPEATGAVAQRLADLQRAAGLEGVLLDVYSRGGSTVTVTGWVALACIFSIVLVSLASVVVVVRRVAGVDKPHTQFVKAGDV